MAVELGMATGNTCCEASISVRLEGSTNEDHFEILRMVISCVGTSQS